MKKYEITLFCTNDFRCGFEYMTIQAEDKMSARKYAKDNLCTFGHYQYKIIRVVEIKN